MYVNTQAYIRNIAMQTNIHMCTLKSDNNNKNSRVWQIVLVYAYNILGRTKTKRFVGLS